MALKFHQVSSASRQGDFVSIQIEEIQRQQDASEDEKAVKIASVKLRYALCVEYLGADSVRLSEAMSYFWYRHPTLSYRRQFFGGGGNTAIAAAAPTVFEKNDNKATPPSSENNSLSS